MKQYDLENQLGDHHLEFVRTSSLQKDQLFQFHLTRLDCMDYDEPVQLIDLLLHSQRSQVQNQLV